MQESVRNSGVYVCVGNTCSSQFSLWMSPEQASTSEVKGREIVIFVVY